MEHIRIWDDKCVKLSMVRLERLKFSKKTETTIGFGIGK